jgi:D-alanine-D-alanine ligase
MKRHMKISVMMDQGAIPSEDPEFTGKEDATTTEGHVVTALRELGHEVGILGVGYEVEPIVQHLKERQPEIVFNLSEQFRGDRRLDANVAGLLELMGVRFTGTGSAGLLICRDKGLCKEILSRHRIRVPDFLVFPRNRSVRIPKNFRFPVIVKPALEDASDGISQASVVKNTDELLERARFVHEKWEQLAIGEEYITGRELYVTILGNRRLIVLPPREIIFGDENGPPIATSRVKWDKEYREKWKIDYRAAKLPDDLFRKIARVCKRAYRLLHLRDFGRVDLRVEENGRIVVLEVNPNPDVAYGEDVAESAAAAGIGYNDLIDRILRAALRRYAEK